MQRPIALPTSQNIASPAALSGSHLRAYEAIFRHPLAHNLEWHDVYAMLRRVAHVEEESNGHLRVTRNGQVLVLPPPNTKDVSTADEVMALRHFLERSEISDPSPLGSEAHWLLVIDHHEARVFRTEVHGAVPQKLLPHEPDRYFRHAHNSKDFSRGQEKPEPNSYFEPVAESLGSHGEVLVFGSGSGSGSEMEQFIAWVAIHRPQISGRIIGSVVVDAHHLTEDQLLAKAREFYSGRPHVLT